MATSLSSVLGRIPIINKINPAKPSFVVGRTPTPQTINRRPVSDLTSSATVNNVATTYGGAIASRAMPDILIPYDQSALYKAVIPEWLYKPVFGKPRSVNLPELRRLSKSPHVAMCVNTIINEVCSLPWEIQPKDPEKPNDKALDEVTARFEHPNANTNENFSLILRQVIQDILELDSGVIIKFFTFDSYYEDEATGMWLLKPLGQRELVGFKAYDGVNFTKNPDSYGIMPEQMSYWQYSWATYQRPTAFARDEVMYMVQYPQTSSGTYGRSPVEVLTDIAQSLLYSVDWLKDFYTSNTIPPGILTLLEADRDTISAFRENWNKFLIKRDEFGNAKRYFHTMPIVNNKTEFTPISVGMQEMQVLESQQWWLKIVAATFNITPSELGITDDVNRATDLSQTEVFKRKAIKPLLQLIEFHINNQLIPEFGYDDILFKFVDKDPIEERRKKEMAWQELKLGARTINDYRAEFGEDEDSKTPVEWGDKPFSSGGGFGGGEIGQGMDEQFRELSPNEETPKPPSGFKSWEEAFETWERRLVNLGTNTKALSATTGGASGNAGSALVPISLEQGIKDLTRKWFDDRLKIFMGELERQRDNESLTKSVEKKGMAMNVLKAILERIESFLMPSEDVRLQIGTMAKEAYFKAHYDAEKQLDMNVDFDPEKVNLMAEMTFNDVVGMSKDIASDLRREFHDGMIKGESIAQLAKRVKSVFDVTDSRAEMIARTTMTKVANTSRIEAYRKSGVVKKVEWVTARDDKVCPNCKSNTGTYPISKFPRPATDTHPQCRCQIVPYFKE